MRVNEAITAPTLHLIDEEGKSLHTVSRDQALYLAFEKGVDLVEVSQDANPPVARLIDYGKYLYTLQKKKQKAKSHHKESELKEIRLGFKTDAHDFETKLKRALDFFKHGHKVRLSMKLRGRERVFANDSILKLEKFCVKASAKFVVAPKILGNTITAIISKNNNAQVKIK